MKKYYSILLVLALLLPVLAGCQSSAPAAKPTDPPAPTQTSAILESTVPETTAPLQTQTPIQTSAPIENVKTLTLDEAIEIALKDAGFTKDQVHDLDAELDRDNGILHYDVDFEKDNKDYDYEIDAASGKILRSEKERD